MHVKKGDKVMVISGKDKGKTGVILSALPKKDRVLVEGVNIVKKHSKPSQMNPQGGIINQEAPIHVSNVMPIDPKTGEIITPPAGVLPDPDAQPAVAKKPLAELRETLSPVPGGGVMINLDERFHTPLSATIDIDGKVKFQHKQTSSDDKN